MRALVPLLAVGGSPARSTGVPLPGGEVQAKIEQIHQSWLGSDAAFTKRPAVLKDAHFAGQYRGRRWVPIWHKETCPVREDTLDSPDKAPAAHADTCMAEGRRFIRGL